MIAQDELDEWSINAGFFLLEIELFDREWRAKNSTHKCHSWYDSGNGRWFCYHLVFARERNKKLNLLQAVHTLSSPFVRNSESLSKVSKSLNLYD